jgi:hypothetical protein
MKPPVETEIYYEQDKAFGGPKNLTINGRAVHAESIIVEQSMNEFSTVTIVFRGVKVTKGKEG